MGGGGPFRPPKHCENCGSAFPWVRQKLTVQQELTDDRDVSEKRESAPEVVDRPTTSSANAAGVFISYSWDSDKHKAWTLSLADRLRGDGVNTVIDQTALRLGSRTTKFMERSVRESDYVLVICTEAYKRRFDNREGGVGYEGHIISGEIVSEMGADKFIPVLRSGNWTTAMPTALSGIFGVDFRNDSSEEYLRLLRHLLESPILPPVKQQDLSLAPAMTHPPFRTTTPDVQGDSDVAARAWIIVQTVESSPDLNSEHVAMRAVTTLLNSGRTPAQRLRTWQKMEIMKSPPSKTDYPGELVEGNHGVLGPGGRSQIHALLEPTPSEFKEIVSHCSTLYLYGVAEYRDVVFNRPNRTCWCLQYVPETKQFSYADDSNNFCS